MTLKDIIKRAGSLSEIGSACEVSTTAVWKWTRYGLPRTEWTGETNYSGIISGLLKKKGIKLSKTKIMEADYG